MASNEDSVYKVPAEMEIKNICELCSKPTRYELDGFACRVCCRVFHVECLQSCDHYTAQEARLVHRAKTRLGWSCQTCDNVCNLLSPGELEDISAQFEQLDVNKDADISEAEFITFQKREHESVFGSPMDEFEEDLLHFQFRMLDADKSGAIDYREFIKHQATKRLGRKDKAELVKLLSANEIRAAKAMFDLLDANKDGTVTESEAKDAYRSFYTCLDSLSNQQPTTEADETGMCKPKAENKALSSHVTLNADQVMEADDNLDLTVDWKEFLCGQALSILASRPNKYGIPNE